MNNDNTKPIFILLTEHKDYMAKFYRFISGGIYTHAAIGVEDKKFFSFGTKKGFRVEKPWLFAKFKKNAELCAVYRLDVSEESYDAVKNRIDEFWANKKEYRFSFIGALFCMLKIPHHFKKQYFCSRFVAETLSESGALELKKPPSLYHPNDFTKEAGFSLCFQGNLEEFANIA